MHMEEIKERAKQMLLSSEVAKLVGEETIIQQFNNIIIVGSREDLKRKYVELTGVEYGSGDLKGLNNGDKHYLSNEADEHTIIHEIMHDLSSIHDKDGHKIKTGIRGNENQQFKNDVNEGLTDFLARKISGNGALFYKQGNRLFEGIESSIVKFFNDDNALLKIYLTNDNDSLRAYIDKVVGKGTYDSIYENLSFMSDEKIDKIVDKIDKGTKKELRKQKIKSFFSKITGKKEEKLLLSEPKEYNLVHKREDVSSVIDEIKGKVNSRIEEIPPIEENENVINRDNI